MSDVIPKFKFVYNSQCFPLYVYETPEDRGLFDGSGPKSAERGDTITQAGVEYFEKAYSTASGGKISKEDIFY